MPEVRLPTAWKLETNGRSSFRVDGETLIEVLGRVVQECSAAEGRLFVDDDTLHRHVIIAVNSEIVYEPADQIHLQEDDVVQVVPSLAGG